MQNLMPLAFSASEKSITIQTNKKANKHSKLNIPHTTVWWDINQSWIWSLCASSGMKMHRAYSYYSLGLT